MLNRRRSIRLTVECPVSFAIEDVEGTGTVYNLSHDGCAVSTSVAVPDEGYASASLTLPGQAEPVLVDLARVRWATPTGFGLEFRILQPSSRKRLLRFIACAKAA
jgi:hypothetical protein